MSNYTNRVERNLKGIEAVSTGICPGCKTCMETYGFKSLRAMKRAWETGGLSSESSFSWSACDICDSRLGGDREEWHGIMDGKIIHGDGACIDCVLYLANGDEPETSEQEGA